MVDDAGQGGHKIQIELPLQPLLNDLHVEHAQKAAPEAETQRTELSGSKVMEASLS